jgi:NADH-quinone oxidoreductase subunit N
MIPVAFGFQSEAAPFHFWAPDAYQGAPATSGALIASASKLAGWVFFARLLVPGLGGVVGAGSAEPLAWLPAVAVLAAASVLVGNLAALAQTNVRRLLAYSAVSHAGALMLGVIAASRSGPAPVFFYAATYGLATVGAFGVVAVLDGAGGAQSIEDLAGLWRRSPGLALCLLVFVLSLAGVPPFAGFFGKVFVFTAAFHAGGITAWLAGGAILFSAVGFYYYLRILKPAFTAPAKAGPISVPFPAALALGLAALLLVIFGLFPDLLLGRFPTP